jgi:hypothetical protein
MERPPRQGSQRHTGMGTTTVGIPRSESSLASGAKSLFPDRKPGTITAHRSSGRAEVERVAASSGVAEKTNSSSTSVRITMVEVRALLLALMRLEVRALLLALMVPVLL